MMTDAEFWKALKCNTFREKEEGEFPSVLPARIFPLGLKAPKFSAGSACRPLRPVGPNCGYGPDFSMNTATTQGPLLRIVRTFWTVSPMAALPVYFPLTGGVPSGEIRRLAIGTVGRSSRCRSEDTFQQTTCHPQYQRCNPFPNSIISP